MPVDPQYDVVHPLAIAGEFYGCKDKTRPYIGMSILNQLGKDTGIKYRASTECKYDLNKTDKRCGNCVHKRIVQS